VESSHFLGDFSMNIIAGPQGPEPDPVLIVYQMGVAMRRLLILVDSRKSAARSARVALAQADAMLERRAISERKR